MNADTIKAKLTGLALAEQSAIADWDVTVGSDSTGDPAVWVFVIVRDDRLADFEPTWNDARWRIKGAVSEVAPEAFTYVRMQLESEVEHPMAANR